MGAWKSSFEIAKEKGEKRGEKRGRREVALEMLKDGVNTHKIAAYTGLTTEEIEELSKGHAA